MSFLFAPFIFVFELLGFLFVGAFMYGLALIASVTFLIYGIADLKSKEPVDPIIKYVTVVEKHEVTKFLEKGPELTCTRVTGCELFPNAKTEEEYCPTCVIK
jgi:hypothetical protein